MCVSVWVRGWVGLRVCVCVLGFSRCPASFLRHPVVGYEAGTGALLNPPTAEFVSAEVEICY